MNLLPVSDATLRLAAIWCLIGWGGGVAFALAVWWRAITRARHENREIRRLRMALEDSDRQLAGQFACADRLARLLAERAGRTGGQAA